MYKNKQKKVDFQKTFLTVEIWFRHIIQIWHIKKQKIQIQRMKNLNSVKKRTEKIWMPKKHKNKEKENLDLAKKNLDLVKKEIRKSRTDQQKIQICENMEKKKDLEDILKSRFGKKDS